MTWYVYILLCDNKKYYVGLTDDLNRRLEQHKKGQSFYTKQFSNIAIKYSETFEKRSMAEVRERQLKGWSVAKKKSLIAGDKSALIQQSKSTWSDEASGSVIKS